MGSDWGISYISKIMIPVPSVCNYCRQQREINHVVSLRNGGYREACSDCRDRLAADAGITDREEAVLVFPEAV